MEVKEMIEFLKLGNLRVIENSQRDYGISHTCKNTVIYFTKEGSSIYDSYGNYKDSKTYNDLLIRLSRIVRIEKKMYGEYFPIWTKEDGLITQTEKFVKLRGRYYTINFLEQLIDKISEFKKLNI